MFKKFTHLFVFSVHIEENALVLGEGISNSILKIIIFVEFRRVRNL